MTEHPPSYKGNILIVDDTLPNLRILARILMDHGYLVRGIPNGKTAIEAALAERPDLILLDIMMPEMDGYEVCQRLKADPRTADIPVIFMSALDEVFNKVKAFSLGGVDYITKPFQVEEVLARVNTHITLQALQAKLAHQVIELQQANAALKASNEELDAFAHTVAHDLKNPLANIILGVTLLREIAPSPRPEEITKVAGWLDTGAQKATNIIDELLLLASVRQEDVKREPVNMKRVVHQACKRLEWLIKQHHGEIVVPAEWPVALGYAPWIEEVWVNYISNGLKYGGVPPRLELGAESFADHTVRYWITDNGPGIPAEKLPLLFGEFTRLERIRAEGHGLGLSIVKRILTKLGGSVGVDSQPGKGSTFYFALPTAPEEGAEGGKREKKEKGGRDEECERDYTDRG